MVIGIIFGIDRKIKSGSAENIAAKACRYKFDDSEDYYEELLVPQYRENKSETYENVWDEKKMNSIHYTMDTTIIAVLIHWQLILMRVMMHGCRSARHS